MVDAPPPARPALVEVYTPRPGVGQIYEVDYSRELRRGIRPPCIDMEHRRGVCPLGLDHRVEEHEAHNTLTDSYREGIVDAILGTTGPVSLLVTRVAAGTSAVVTTTDMTQLVHEIYRAAPVGLEKISATQATVFWFFGVNVANALLQEHGILAGAASSIAGSGKMIARFLLPIDNTGKTLSGQYDLTIA